ncbi:MAG TPA: protein kinase, partial [Gemmataceae bacterium]|nr:protein kinase [Gemmataceae bacterium]
MSTSTAEREQQLNAILVPLVQALEKGQSLDRQQLLRAHPEFAVELQEFLAGRDCLRRFRGQEPPRSRPTLRGGDLGSIGDFQLLREIGRGGMGIVYEARQVSLDRRVALKVLPAAVALDKRQLQRFHNEAHAAALLSHAHIVPIYAVGCEGDTHYYAMQFIEGPSLAAMIQGLRQPPAGPPATVPTVNQHPRVAQPTPTHRLPIPLPVSPQGPVANASNTLAPSAVGTARSAWKAHYFRRVAELGTRAAEAL